MTRIVCWWSAGVASATAAKVADASASEDAEVVIAYCDTSSTEHPDNLRFFADCEQWYGQKILRLRSEEYHDIWDVFERTGWLVGVRGARCTTELKKRVRQRFERADDVHVFGFTADEKRRADRFVRNNPELDVVFPLIDRGLTHADCKALIAQVGIAVPEMYKLGYKNNNCIGCVKGGAGYWNKIRRDFPEIFARMAQVERQLDVAINKRQEKGRRLRVFLDELPPNAGCYEEEQEQEIECGVACGTTLEAVDRSKHGGTVPRRKKK